MPGKSDLALRNANFITMNPQQPHAEALAVREGRIVAVGEWLDVAPFAEGAPTLDLEGKSVLPGFIDSHVHFTWTGLKEAALDFTAVETVEQVQASVAEAVAETPPGRLVFGMGLNQYRFPKRQLPTSADLDAVAPGRAVFILGVTGHYALANTRCLAELDLPPTTPGLDPSGVLRDRANTLAEAKMNARFIEEQGLERLHRAAAQQASAAGLTTVHALEGDDQPGDPTVTALMNIAPDLPLHLVIWYQTTRVEAAQALGLPRIGGCILLDGDFGPRTAALLEPYADQPDNRGTLYYSQEQVNIFVESAHRAGLQIAMHAVGDRAAKQALDAYQRALARWPRADHRHRIEHFEIYDEALVQRARELGVYLAIQPPFNVYFGGHARLNPILGQERALRSDPVCSLVEAGIPVGGGSDSTVIFLQRPFIRAPDETLHLSLQVHVKLVCYLDQKPEHVNQFIPEIRQVFLFFPCAPINSIDRASQLSYFFGQMRHELQSCEEIPLRLPIRILDPLLKFSDLHAAILPARYSRANVC